MSIKGFEIGGNVERVDYNYLDNKPNIPSKTSELTNDSQFLSMAEWMNFAVADNPDLNRDDADLYVLEQNKIYYRNATSHSPAHLPYSSFTGIVVTYRPFAYNSGQVVLAISHNGKMFSCASTGAAPGTYSDWHEYSLKEETISHQGQLTSADDMHNLRYPGMYWVALSNPPDNFPFSGSGDFRVLVNKSSYDSHYGETHFVMGSSALWVEKCLDGSNWSGWKQLVDINEVIAYRGVLNSTNDTHDISYPGMYHIQLSSRPANFPYESDTGTSTARLLVSKSSTASNHNGETHFIMSSDALWVERSLNEAGTSWSGWKRLYDAGVGNESAYDSYPHKTINGGIASIKDGASEIPVKNISVTIIPTQSGSGDPTPSNKRPINEGFTEVSVNHTGKNLLKVTYPSKTVSGITATMNSNGTISVSGTASATVFIPVAKLDRQSGAVGNILSGCPSNGGSTTYELQLDVDGSYGGRDYGSGASITRCGSQNIVYICVRNGVTINETFRPMVRRSGDSSTWVKYKDRDFAIALPNDAGVVYGGILDITNGVLTITKVKVALGSLTWKKGTAGNRGAYYYYATGLESVVQKPPTATHVPDIICSDYKTTSSNEIYNIETGDLISITAADAGYPGRVWIMDSRHVSGDYTETQFKSLLQSAGAEMVYTLDTPIIYQLMPAEVKTIYQFNNIWAVCGDVSVDYRADPDLYMTASMAIPSGKYFMVGDALYLSTASIAAGAKIIVGTNCNMVNLADALNAINA